MSRVPIVLRVAKDRIPASENLTIVAAGNSKDFSKPLTALQGKVTTLDLTIPEDKTPVAAAPAKTPASAQSIALGKQLLASMQQSMGGSDKLAAIKDSSQSLEMSMDPSAGGLKLKQTVRFVAPNHYRQDQELPFGKVIAYTNGATGWLSSPMQGMMMMPPDILKQWRMSFSVDWWACSALRPRYLPHRECRGRPYGRDRRTSDGQSARLEVDPATGPPAKAVLSSAGPRRSHGRSRADLFRLARCFRIQDALQSPNAAGR